MEDVLVARMFNAGTRLQHWWEYEDAELQFEKSRRRNQWKFLNSVKAENQYQKEAIHEYHVWSKFRGFPNFSEPLSDQSVDSDAKVLSESSEDSIYRESRRESPHTIPFGVVNGADLPTKIVHQIIGGYAGLIVDKGSEKERKKSKSEDVDSLTLPREVVNQILGEYAEKAVDKGTKKQKKKNKKEKHKAKAEDDVKMFHEETDVTIWERNLRILMEKFSMPREKADKVMTQAKGEPFEAVRIVGEEVRITMESLANQISKKDAIQLHIQTGWSASELRKAKQQWLAKAGIPRDMQRMVLTGRIAK